MSTLPDYAIEISGLSKVYRSAKLGESEALSGIDLQIPRGSLFGLLGPNGAGKSTLIGILGGIVIKSSGSVRIWDLDIDKEARNSRAAIGIVPQELNIDPFFTPYQLLDLHAGLYGVPRSERRIDEILDMVGLYEKRDAYARTLSGGMRRRLLIGKAMVHNPPILVLDEPTAGVDIALRRQLWDNVRVLNEGGTTVLLTTHYLEEAQELCDRIAIINHGRVVANDSKVNLLRSLDSKTLRFVIGSEPRGVISVLSRFTHEYVVGADGRLELVVQYQPSGVGIGDLVRGLVEGGVEILDISSDELDLEDIFLQLIRDDA